MAITRTAKGTATSKVSGTTLTISNVEIAGSVLVVVGVSWDATVGNPTVAHGSHNIPFRIHDSGGGNGISTAIFARKRAREDPRTYDIVATFPDAVTAKAMFVTEYTEVDLLDFVTSNDQIGVSSTNAGIATQTGFDIGVCSAAFGSEGPVEDAGATALLGYTLGQRAGTTGGVADTNITIQETYKLLTTSEVTRGRLTVTTARDFTNCLATWHLGTFNDQGLVPGEFYLVSQKFSSLGLDFQDAAYMFNYDLDRWEVFDKADMTTVIADSDTGWV